MNIHTEKLDLIEWISKLNDTSIIERIQKIKKNYIQSKDWGDKLNQEEIKSIEEGLKDLEEGRIHSHETAKNIYEKYL